MLSIKIVITISAISFEIFCIYKFVIYNIYENNIRKEFYNFNLKNMVNNIST